MANDDQMLDLLGLDNPAKARQFLAAWAERRNASFVDSDREAKLRSASRGHEPAARGQYRYHMGEQAIRDAATDAGYGYLAMSTVKPGATFIAARVGRFALVSVNIRFHKRMPRRSSARLELSQGNQGIDPQIDCLIQPPASVLAYLGCLVSVPNPNDHTAPEELAFAIPSRDLRSWLAWIPVSRASAMLQTSADNGGGSPSAGDQPIPDNAFSTLRIPAQENDAGEEF